MRSFVTGWMVVASVFALASAAWASNQEVAEEIARNLRQSGQMHDYKIGVKYQQGTAWLVGQVTSEQQLTTALNLVMQSPHVERVVNNLSVSKGKATPVGDAQEPKMPDQHTQTGSSQLRIGRVRDVAPNPASADGASVQPSRRHNGPTTAERLQRVVDNLTGAEQSQPANDTETREGSNQADRVPASFEPAPAQPTSSAQATPAQPTPAQPTPAQPAPAQPAPAQPAPPEFEAAQPTAAQPALAQRTAAPSTMPNRIQPQQAPLPNTQARVARHPVPVAYTQPNAGVVAPHGMAPAGPRPMYTAAAGGGVAPARYDQPRMPNYAWPSYAAYPNYAAVTYPKQYSPTAWPYIGPFYPYPQVPLGWRKVTLEWDNGWWMLDFKDR